jgi:hypothetical protein
VIPKETKNQFHNAIEDLDSPTHKQALKSSSKENLIEVMSSSKENLIEAISEEFESLHEADNGIL